MESEIESVSLAPPTETPSAPELLIEDAGKQAENLHWSPRDQSLWWSDFTGGAVYRFETTTKTRQTVYEGPPVGALVPQENGSWLLFREKDVVVLVPERREPVPLIEHVRVDGDRFNHALADSRGRVLVGTMRAGRPNGAGIYRLDPRGTLAKVLGGTGGALGMGWSLKDDALFWSCSTTKTIFRCLYDVRRGAVINRVAFHECLPAEGVPDGLAIDSEGTLWSARREAGTGVILKIAMSRRLVGQITLPVKQVSSLVFGGPEYRTVFVAGWDEAGVSKIFTIPSAVPGRPELLANVTYPTV